VPARVKQERCEAAMAVQREISRECAQSQVGEKLLVLAEKIAGHEELANADIRSWEHGHIRETTASTTRLEGNQFTVARGEADAPDIDGRVLVAGELPLGDFSSVRITGHTDYDLIAERL